MSATAIDTVTLESGRMSGYECRDGLLEIEDGLALHHGGRLAPVRIAYRLAGRRGAPVVAVMGGISAGRLVFGLEQEHGWWQGIVGPGCALDTDRYRVLGIDFLGGSHSSTGPGPGQRFPSVSSFDQADSLRHVLDHLAIARLAGCAGASYGGMVALAFAESYPDRLDAAIVVSAAHRSHPMATAWRSVQRAIVRYALEHGEGGRGLALARALAMATYRSSREFEERFAGMPEPGPDGFRFPVESYLLARGERYAVEYRPEAFVCLSESIDLHRVNPDRIRVPVTLLAIAEDQIVPVSDVRALRDGLGGGCQLIEISSTYGHDAFLKEQDVLRNVFAQALEQP
jgi:homoserine O-acetyltransferase/O-succinyltransferase